MGYAKMRSPLGLVSPRPPGFSEEASSGLSPQGSCLQVFLLSSPLPLRKGEERGPRTPPTRACVGTMCGRGLMLKMSPSCPHLPSTHPSSGVGGHWGNDPLSSLAPGLGYDGPHLNVRPSCQAWPLLQYHSCLLLKPSLRGHLKTSPHPPSPHASVPQGRKWGAVFPASGSNFT